MDKDIYLVRASRLREAMRARCDNKQSALAEALGVADNYVSRMLYPPEKNGRKRIGSDFAREIELKLGLSPGYLDGKDADSRPMRVEESKTRLYGHDVTEEAVIFAKEWEKLTPLLRSQVQALVHVMVAELVREGREKKPSASGTPRTSITPSRPNRPHG